MSLTVIVYEKPQQCKVVHKQGAHIDQDTPSASSSSFTKADEIAGPGNSRTGLSCDLSSCRLSPNGFAPPQAHGYLVDAVAMPEHHMLGVLIRAKDNQLAIGRLRDDERRQGDHLFEVATMVQTLPRR